MGVSCLGPAPPVRTFGRTIPWSPRTRSYKVEVTGLNYTHTHLKPKLKQASVEVVESNNFKVVVFKPKMGVGLSLVNIPSFID